MTEDYWNKLWNKRMNKIFKNIIEPLFESEFKNEIIDIVKGKLKLDLKINDKIINELEFNQDEYFIMLRDKFYDISFNERTDLTQKSSIDKIITIIIKTLIVYYFNLFTSKLKSWNLLEIKKDHTGMEIPEFDYDEMKSWNIIKTN